MCGKNISLFFYLFMSSSSVIRFFAQAVSVVLHPIWMCTFAAVYYLWSNPYYFHPLRSPQGATVLFSFVRDTLIFPAAALFLLQKLNFIKDIAMEERKQRLLPLLILMILMFSAYFNFKRFEMQEPLQDLMLGAAFSLLGAYFANVMRFKISLHGIGAGCLVAAVLYSVRFSLYNIDIFLMAAILLAGLAGTARLLLKAHTSQEVYAGYAMGYTLQLLAFLV